MPKIFISYRRDDSNAITGRIRQSLVARFGSKNVFRDLNSIPLGADFRDVIEKGLSWSDVILVIIGDKWVNIADSKGNKRLDNPDDFVRIEVETALRLHKKVIPVLVNKAVMPTIAELPSTLSRLPGRNAAIVREDPDFDNDMMRLIAAISGQNQWLGYLITTVIGIAILVTIGLVVSKLTQVSPSITPTTVVIADVPTNTPSAIATVAPSETLLALSNTPVSLTDTPIPPTLATMSTSPPTPPPSAGMVQLELSFDSSTLTLYVSQKVSLAGLQFVVVNNGTQEIHPLEQAFTILQLTQYIVEANSCSVYRLVDSVSPLPNKCDVNRTLRQDFARSDIFWYDSVKNMLRDVAVYYNGNFIALCSAASPLCIINWPVSSTPTPSAPTDSNNCEVVIASPSGSNAVQAVRDTPSPAGKLLSITLPVGQHVLIVDMTGSTARNKWFQITDIDGNNLGWIPQMYVESTSSCNGLTSS